MSLEVPDATPALFAQLKQLLKCIFIYDKHHPKLWTIQLQGILYSYLDPRFIEEEQIAQLRKALLILPQVELKEVLSPDDIHILKTNGGLGRFPLFHEKVSEALVANPETDPNQEA